MSSSPCLGGHHAPGCVTLLRLPSDYKSSSYTDTLTWLGLGCSPRPGCSHVQMPSSFCSSSDAPRGTHADVHTHWLWQHTSSHPPWGCPPHAAHIDAPHQAAPMQTPSSYSTPADSPHQVFFPRVCGVCVFHAPTLHQATKPHGHSPHPNLGCNTPQQTVLHVAALLIPLRLWCLSWATPIYGLHFTWALIGTDSLQHQCYLALLHLIALGLNYAGREGKRQSSENIDYT